MQPKIVLWPAQLPSLALPPLTTQDSERRTIEPLARGHRPDVPHRRIEQPRTTSRQVQEWSVTLKSDPVRLPPNNCLLCWLDPIGQAVEALTSVGTPLKWGWQ